MVRTPCCGHASTATELAAVASMRTLAQHIMPRQDAVQDAVQGAIQEPVLTSFRAL
jgi:hypothetical protein